MVSGKNDLIKELLTKGIVEKLNKKTIQDNSEFSDVIYNVLNYMDLDKKKIRVTYFPADQIIHFKTNESEEYGESVFKNSLFISKVYVAVLTATFMMKIVRSPTKELSMLKVV